jgi:Ni/Co efflux regulator RcnB
MLSKKLLYPACAVLMLCMAPGTAFGDRDHDQDDDRGDGHAYGHDKHDRDSHRRDAKVERHEEKMERHEDRHHYQEHDRELHAWYLSHHDHLPPGLAKRDQLPPGLERQLVVRGTLPPALRSRMHPCPAEVRSYLPPAPVGYMHTVIGGNIVLVNRKTFVVMDVFHFQM